MVDDATRRANDHDDRDRRPIPNDDDDECGEKDDANVKCNATMARARLLLVDMVPLFFSYAHLLGYRTMISHRSRRADVSFTTELKTIDVGT
jgi:hypothetical protein